MTKYKDSIHLNIALCTQLVELVQIFRSANFQRPLVYWREYLFFQASDAYHFFTSGQTKIQQGLLKDGYDLICEALNLLNNVYGAMHPEIAACLRLLARLNYIMGDYGEVRS